MNTSEYERRVLDYLAEIGATQVAVDRTRGRHHAVYFRYDGHDRRATLAASPSDRNAATIKIGDIKRMLGISTAPKASAEAEKLFSPVLRPEQADELKSAPAPTPAPAKVISTTAPPTPPKPREATAIGSVSHYTRNKTLNFRFPKEIAACLSNPRTGFTINKTGEGSWEIKKDGGFSKCHPEGHIFVFRIGVSASDSKLLLGGLPSGFHSTPAEYVAVGDHILVRMLEIPVAIRPVGPVVSPAQQPDTDELRRVATAAAVSTLDNGLRPTAGQMLAYLESRPELSPADLRAVLHCIRYIEERTSYRLKRVNEVLVLEARIE